MIATWVGLDPRCSAEIGNANETSRFGIADTS